LRGKRFLEDIHVQAERSKVRGSIKTYELRHCIFWRELKYFFSTYYTLGKVPR
jgi:hypothetical protein